MNVTDAILTRSSIRAYTPEAPSREALSELLETAARTPSWANTQPWEVYVATGNTLARIKRGFADAYAAKTPIGIEIPRPDKWTLAAQERTKGLFPDMQRDCGEAVSQFGELNSGLFNAPAVIYLCVDKSLSSWSLYDTGAYSQSVMLLAVERGLSTIPAITLVNYPDVVRRELSVPDNLYIAIGIAIGYADKGNAINNFKSARDPISKTVVWKD